VVSPANGPWIREPGYKAISIVYARMHLHVCARANHLVSIRTGDMPFPCLDYLSTPKSRHKLQCTEDSLSCYTIYHLSNLRGVVPAIIAHSDLASLYCVSPVRLFIFCRG
jgi:hypothetical protein